MQCDRNNIKHAGNIQSLWLYFSVFQPRPRTYTCSCDWKGGDAKYVWNGTEFAFYEQHNIKANDLKKIKMMIDENSDLIIRHWNRYFGKEENNED